MKLLFACLCALFTLAFANVVEIKNTAEDGNIARFETDEIASEDEGAAVKKRYLYSKKCQSGTVKSKYCSGIPANRCFGSNGQSKYVSFSPWFYTKPSVTLGFSLIDTHKDQNVRVRVSAVSVSRFGFFVKFTPWDRSITYQVGVNWMACP